jgi:hypothetical protein
VGKLKLKRIFLSVLVTMSMLLILLVPLAGIASAGTTYSTITTVPDFAPGNSGSAELQGATFEVAIDPYDAAITSTALLEVIDGSGRALPIISVTTGGVTTTLNGTVGEKIFNYTFVGTQDSDNHRLFYQDLTLVFDGRNASTGAVQVKFSKAAGQLVSSTITNANAIGGTVEVSVPRVVAIGDAGNTAGGTNPIEIRLNETASGGFVAGDDSVKLTLPAGFKWNSATLKTLNKTVDGFTADYTLDDGRTLSIHAPGGYSGTVQLQILAGITVDSTTAKHGEIKVKVGGESNVTLTDIIIGTSASDKTKNIMVFTIGSINYTFNGVQRTMDVAPYIDTNDRTLLPVRFAANAAGISDSNIFWNAATKGVTLMGNARTVMLVVGSPKMWINSVEAIMDTVPVIKDPPGRTMLPIRYVAQALDCDIVWDASAKTITITQTAAIQ